MVALASAPCVYVARLTCCPGMNPEIYVGRGSETYGFGIRLDDCTFHESIRQEFFERERVLCLVPPEGEFVAMSYRIASEFPLPFRIMTSFEVVCVMAVLWALWHSPRLTSLRRFPTSVSIIS